MLNMKNEAERILNEYNLSDISVIPVDLGDEPAFSYISSNGNAYIGINDNIDNVAELKSALLHEAGHIREKAYYNVLSNKNDKRHAEYLAIRWAIKTCIPFSEYVKAIQEGVRTVYELAERFNITVASAMKVTDYYESQLIHYLQLRKDVVYE